MKQLLFATLLFATTVSAQDVLVANPKTTKLRTENDKVRVIEATIPPGAKENMHSHPASLIYVIAGGKARNHYPDGSTKDAVFKTNDVVYREPLTHWAENIGKTTMRLIVIELKK